MNGSTDHLIGHGVHRERIACKAGSPSVAINGNTCFLLLIDQVLQTPLFEFHELGCVKIENFGVSESIPDSLQHCIIAQQPAKIAGLPLIFEQTAQRERDLKTGSDPNFVWNSSHLQQSNYCFYAARKQPRYPQKEKAKRFRFSSAVRAALLGKVAR